LVILRMVDELGRMVGGWVNAEIHGREPLNAVEA
jgi:hypothetical protein